MVVAIMVKLQYTVIREAYDEPTAEGSVARPDGQRAGKSRTVGACDERARGARSAGAGAARGGRGRFISRGGAACGASPGGCGRELGSQVQSRGVSSHRAPPWGRP